MPAGVQADCEKVEQKLDPNPTGDLDTLALLPDSAVSVGVCTAKGLLLVKNLTASRNDKGSASNII